MGRSSLRSWLLVVSILFAMAVVGGIAITTYIIVADGMQGVALDTTQRLATTAMAKRTETTSSHTRRDERPISFSRRSSPRLEWCE